MGTIVGHHGVEMILSEPRQMSDRAPVENGKPIPLDIHEKFAKHRIGSAHPNRQSLDGVEFRPRFLAYAYQARYKGRAPAVQDSLPQRQEDNVCTERCDEGNTPCRRLYKTKKRRERELGLCVRERDLCITLQVPLSLPK
jgi:hypothetical protein